MNYNEKLIYKTATEAYLHGDVQFEMNADKCALLVIDMQDEFVKPGWTPFWVPDATKQVSKIKILIDFCRNKDIPVIYTAFRESHLLKDRPKSGSIMPNRYTHLGTDTCWFKEGNIWHELEPKKDEIVIFKPSYGAFYDTPLETILKNLEKDTVLICGTLTNYCCGTTARQGYERGFKVIFGSDITSTDHPDMQEPELQVLRKGFAKVMDFESILNFINSNKFD